ncbi:hypothetical protein ABT297_42785 [Dactylosporangium sp. NPDC000555]|uniref:hypothetical protein n=1 Tax=Dactylosporangium sp. NPDC000555 TaxID=3154260 RepID=UPI00332483D7
MRNTLLASTYAADVPQLRLPLWTDIGMRARMGSIRKLPSKNFQAAVLMSDGKRKTKTFATEHEAISWTLDLEAERDRLRTTSENERSHVTAVALLNELQRLVEEDLIGEQEVHHLWRLTYRAAVRLGMQLSSTRSADA